MSENHDYYIQRAEEELEIAQHSHQPEAVKVHYTLAGFYLDRAYGTPEDAPAPSASLNQLAAAP